MDNIYQSIHKINEMYTDLTYFDQYGGSVFIFIVLIIILCVVFAYATVMKNIQPIKDDWVNQRCKPSVIPFAGFINKPEDMSAFDFTGQNFTGCLQNILISISGFAIQPISYVTHTLSGLFEVIVEAIQQIRKITSSIRSNMSNITSEIMGRIANIIVPLQQIIISVVDSMEKVKGILTAGLYTSLGTYYVLKSLLGAIVQFIITILIVLAALILAMWIIPFTWPVALTMTLVFISITIPLAIIVVFFTEVLHVQVDMSIPGVPSRPAVCFDKKTIFKMEDGSYKTIYNINVGDKLFNNGYVTSKMKLCAKNAQMYNLNGIVVSGSHMVQNGDKMIPVSIHPSSKILTNYKELYIYCLNTSTKEIIINDTVFYDWDEVSLCDVLTIFDTHNKNILLTNKMERAVAEGAGERGNSGDVSRRSSKDVLDISTSKLHNYFDGGFSGATMITLSDGVTQKAIKDIDVGDKLKNNECVYGIVEIDGETMDSQYKFNLGPLKTFEGGSNLNLCDPRINITSSLELLGSGRCVKSEKHSKLYHLLTDTQTFYVGDLKFYHYNSAIELFLERYRPKLLSIKYV